jgi:hypothetical protein
MGSLGSHDLDFERRYDDLLQEALARIPVYEAEWTDLNDNEPGIAIVQLMAWLSEQLIYRLGQVPKLNVEQARSSYETAAAQIPQIESQIAQTEDALFHTRTLFIRAKTQIDFGLCLSGDDI